MPSALPYFRHFTGDYARETRLLSTLEHGAYHLLLDAYWDNGGPLPSDPATLRRLTRTTKREWAKMQSNILSLFDTRDDVITHTYLEQELAKARERVESARVKGQASGASRRGEKTGTTVEPQLNYSSNPVRTEGELNANSSSPSLSSSSLRSEEECSSSVPSEELLVSQPKSAKKPRASKSTSGPFNPTLLPLPVFVLWKAIVELRWRDDGVPEKHAREAAEVATWLYEKRNATTDDLVNWVRWWWKHPDSMGARQGSRPWPTNVKNSWDTCFLAPSVPDAGMTPAQKAGAEARRKGALVQAELDRRKAERERGLLT